MSAAATDARTAHAVGVRRLLESYRALPQGAQVRLAKRTSNLFRTRASTDAGGLDTSGLTGVINVDPAGRTADVAGMCAYEDLVAATLPHGLAPLVVPQLKTITLGGAVTGLGIESTSFRSGLPHESVLEMDILTGAGEVVTASPGEHADLFRAFPNSYGTLGYAVRLRIELETVRPFVALTHVRFHAIADLIAAMDRVARTRRLDDLPVDYLDGVVFSADESYLCVGTQTSAPGPVSDYTGGRIYYRSIQHDDATKADRLTIHDYLWRWDTDWFWCSAAFGAQHPLVRRLWPRRYLRSATYGRLMRLERRFDIGDRLEKLRGRPARERVIQDVEVPIARCAEFVEWFLGNVPIAPIWLCPLRLRDGDAWPLYPLRPREMYVNVGFWSTVPIGATEGETNRLIERRVSESDGHKSLYSDAYYTRDDFDKLYGGADYRSVKTRYDPDARLLELYQKAVQRR
ncbi:FAD-binding oxidoreductase [Microbacterium sp. NPDC019599]|uniref:FAD-binding oxidoreductase n=1 Tax=Microbacterium sp. NPDC019599 TaxID=3154690 RepID=UPI0033FDD5EB